jgi:alpha-L-fucosidase 2
MARLGDGDACYENILALLRASTRGNLFDVCGEKEKSPFQIDGNLGAPNGFIEMLLQSHAETPLSPPETATQLSFPPHVIRLLPALPKAWPDGSFRGLRARGAVELDVEWQNDRAVTAVLRAQRAATHTIMPPPGQTITGAHIGSNHTKLEQNSDGTVALMLSAGQTATLHFS